MHRLYHLMCTFPAILASKAPASSGRSCADHQDLTSPDSDDLSQIDLQFYNLHSVPEHTITETASGICPDLMEHMHIIIQEELHSIAGHSVELF